MKPTTLSDLYSNWSQLLEQKQLWQSKTLNDLFSEDPNRAERYTVSGAGLNLDFSKNHIDEASFNLLLSIAEQAKLSQAIKKLLRGDEVNNTEKRPALHTALRFHGAPYTDEQKCVDATLKQMSELIDRVYSGQWTGFRGNPIRDVVNIGIGGSDLGPRMVTKALTPFHNKKVKVHFVANIDGAEITDLLTDIDPAKTLFIIASKSFSTLETLQNALTARQWLMDHGCEQDELEKHFIAISSKVDKAVEFGIAEENVYPIWDWVGGRYSLWSAIGLPIAFAIGMENFNKMREGAEAMDSHYASAPPERNIPVLMALIVFWYSNVMGSKTQAVLPYAHHLQLLPSYLQQLEMESNGKSVSKDGQALDYQTGSIVWGTEGTNGQHSFHQLLHQGSIVAPIDFITTLRAHHPLDHQHKYLFSNCVAQSQALMTGRDLDTAKSELRAQGASDEDIEVLAPHKVHPGNRPSSLIFMDALTPVTLGALVAAYEHKVYTLGILWNINSFDQWGVELGKLLGTHIATAIETTDIPTDWDSSTKKLIQHFNNINKTI